MTVPADDIQRLVSPDGVDEAALRLGVLDDCAVPGIRVGNLPITATKLLSQKRDDGSMADLGSVDNAYELPRVPASAGALIFDDGGRLLIVKPNYKKGWTIPGGQMEADGESPWEACQRETLEECGIRITGGRLACVDFLRPKKRRTGGVRFLFDCGTFPEDVLRGVVVDPAEIVEHRLATLDDALDLLSGPLRRRVSAATGSPHCVYLEEGQPVPGVGERIGHQ